MCSLNECLHASQSGEVETLVLCDMDRGQFQIMNLGWQGKKRICSITLLVRLKNGKIWIEEDWTEEGFACHLIEMGVPNEEMVLAFHPPHLRPMTDFATA